MSPDTFGPLPLSAALTGRKLRVRVCLVSPEFIGPHRNGGIGTAYTAMAEALAASGHEVTCLYTKGTECASHDIAHWRAHYRAMNIDLVPLPRARVSVDASHHVIRSYEVYAWLKQNDRFDFIHFPEWQGLGYYTQLARKQGLAFARSRLCVGLHSMTEWLKFANSQYVSDPTELQLEHLERQTVALADVVISPSRYLLDWIAKRGWTLPETCHVQQNIMPRSARAASASRRSLETVKELVFFGRIESRKGVRLLCDALDRLAASGAWGPLERVTFLGSSAVVEGVPGERYVRQRAARWPWTIQCLKDRNQPQAMDYLRGDGRLAVIASLVENSPYTVLECLGAGIAFLTSRVGGIPELIHVADLEAVCFEPRPAALAARLAATLAQGLNPARAAISSEKNERAWVEWHEQQVALVRAQVPPSEPASWPKVSLCLTTFDRPTLLRHALASVRALNYPNLEVVLVDDGSTRPDALACLQELTPDFAARGWKIVRQENRYLGAARNTGARESTGDFLLFMDDDNYAEPDEVTVLVRAMLSSGADILSCGMHYFSGQDAPNRQLPPKGGWLPLGGGAAAGAFSNTFGDANSLVRRSCFEALGGFTEDYGVTHEDWEFHARAVLRGFKLQVVPEFLFWYRVSENSMIRTLAPYPNYMRSIRPYLDAVPAELRGLVLCAQGAALKMTQSGHSGGNEAWAWAEYVKFSVLWRSKLEAGLELAASGSEEQGVRLMVAAAKTLLACKQPHILLEGLPEICTRLARYDAGHTRFLLGMTIKLADSVGRTDEKARAESILASLATPSRETAPRPAVAASASPPPPSVLDARPMKRSAHHLAAPTDATFVGMKR